VNLEEKKETGKKKVRYMESAMKSWEEKQNERAVWTPVTGTREEKEQGRLLVTAVEGLEQERG